MAFSGQRNYNVILYEHTHVQKRGPSTTDVRTETRSEQ